MPGRKRRILWSPEAAEDLVEIAHYLAADSPSTAETILERLVTRAESLSTMSRRGRVVPEAAWVGLRKWRELIVRPYRVIYRLEGRSTVLIGAVIDGRRDVESILLERLTRNL